MLSYGRDKTRSPLSPAKARDAVNAMAKAVFGKMFDWLVRRVNQSMLVSDGEQAERIIGVLDIFGFEIFEKNSFEQMCINFCNEKLQQHFNMSVFKKEEECYRDEGIDFKEVRHPPRAVPSRRNTCRHFALTTTRYTWSVCRTRPGGVQGQPRCA